MSSLAPGPTRETENCQNFNFFFGHVCCIHFVVSKSVQIASPKVCTGSPDKTKHFLTLIGPTVFDQHQQNHHHHWQDQDDCDTTLNGISIIFINIIILIILINIVIIINIITTTITCLNPARRATPLLSTGLAA